MPESCDERLALPIEQGVLLWCMRLWVLGLRRPVDAEWRIGEMLERLGAPDVAPFFEGVMFALFGGATRPISIGCVCAPRLSEDERALLDVFALAQEMRPFEALLVLRGMLSSEGTRAALRSAEGVGTALARAGLFLPGPDAAIRRVGISAERSRSS